MEPEWSGCGTVLPIPVVRRIYCLMLWSVSSYMV